MLEKLNGHPGGLMKVDDYILNQKSPQKEICEKLRKILLKCNFKEEMKWGVPSYDNGKIYFVSLKDHVNLGFSLKDLSTDKIALLKGNGKTLKHLEFFKLDDVNEKLISKFFQ